MVLVPPQVVAHMTIIVSSTKILIILSRDGLRMTSITVVRNAHIVVEEATQLMNVTIYMVFHQTTTKRENHRLTMSL